MAGRFGQIELSPDDRRLAIERVDTKALVDLWMLELATGIYSRITNDPDEERDPVWSPDSQKLLYNVNSGPRHDILQTVIGSGRSSVLYRDGLDNRLDDWSPDGQNLIYHNLGGTKFSFLSLGNGSGGKDGPGKPQPLFDTQYQADEMRVSPDGRSILYGSIESGRWEVYLAAFPSLTGRRQISTNGGVQPRWRRDGREFFFLSPEGEMMSVEVKQGLNMETGLPKVLFKTAAGGASNTHDYAVTSNGQTFYLREPGGEARRAEVNVIVNWPAVTGK